MLTPPSRLLARPLVTTLLPGVALLAALGFARYRDQRSEMQQQLCWRAQALAAALGPASADAAGMQSVLAQQGLPTGWVAGVASPRGTWLTADTPARSLQGLAGASLAPCSGDAALGELRTSQGTPLLAGMAPLAAGSRTAVVAVPRDVLRTGLWRAVARELLPPLALLLVVLALSLRLARRQREQERLRAELEHLQAQLQAAGSRRLEDERSLAAARAELQRVNRTFERDLLRETEAHQQAIARDLHDAIGSALAGIGMLLGSARNFAREPEALALIGQSQEQVRRATQEVRRILRGMMPAGQDRGALLPALEQFAAEMDATQAVRCTVRARGDFTGVPAEVGGHLFRIVQEATANAVRHARARRVHIHLAQTRDGCRLTVRDDGAGCRPALLFAPGAGIGMRSMLARADAIHGRLDVRARPGRGLCIRVTWPAPERVADAA